MHRHRGGPAYCDKRALTLIQHTGFLDFDQRDPRRRGRIQQPICMMIGLLQHDPDTTPSNSPRYGVRIVEPILDAMGIPHHLIERGGGRRARSAPRSRRPTPSSFPVAFLIGRRPYAS